MKKFLTSIKQVQQFNQGALTRYYRAVNDWKQSNRLSGFPSPAIYLFLTEKGTKRKKGYVGTYQYENRISKGYYWDRTKKGLIERLKKEGVII
ncbi:MAG TPA: hypothetical protein ENH95_02760 [Nitrosopumilus sp.]|nr:hypothetical protein [Nitrosopumilus sp.]